MSRPRQTLEGFAIPRAVKGEARSAVPPAPDEKPEGEGADERRDASAVPSRSPQDTVQISMLTVLDQVVPLEVETRTTVSVRLTTSLQERLRVFSFQSRRNKQEIIEQALDAFLRAHGR